MHVLGITVQHALYWFQQHQIITCSHNDAYAELSGCSGFCEAATCRDNVQGTIKSSGWERCGVPCEWSGRNGDVLRYLKSNPTE